MAMKERHQKVLKVKPPRDILALWRLFYSREVVP
jgi:hypothetical protein